MLLASSDRYAHQAFAAMRRGLALQFHSEVEPAGLESWLVGHSVEIAATPGVSVQALRGTNRRLAPALAVAGGTLPARWLSDVTG